MRQGDASNNPVALSRAKPRAFSFIASVISISGEGVTLLIDAVLYELVGLIGDDGSAEAKRLRRGVGGRKLAENGDRGGTGERVGDGRDMMAASVLLELLAVTVQVR